MDFWGWEDIITLGLINYVLLKIIKLVYFFLPIHQRKLKYKDGKDASRQQITNHTMELHEEQWTKHGKRNCWMISASSHL
jgi:hypothetical protein